MRWEVQDTFIDDEVRLGCGEGSKEGGVGGGRHVGGWGCRGAACAARGDWAAGAYSVGGRNNSILGGGLAISVCIGMVEPNTISCNAATSACEKGQEWQCALGLLTSMAQTQLERNTTSYSAAISACAKCGEQMLVW